MGIRPLGGSEFNDYFGLSSYYEGLASTLFESWQEWINRVRTDLLDHKSHDRRLDNLHVERGLISTST